MALRDSPGRKWNSHCQSAPILFTVTLILSLLASVHAQYFIVNQPGASSSWANGSPYPVSWTKGLLDGIDTFDIELVRLREDGLYLVAKNVPSTYNTLNILLQDVPPGDDYFLLCLNSTHGVTYSVSSRFSVTDASLAQSNPSPATSAPTVTVSGTPNPLKAFAATLGPVFNGGTSLGLGGGLSALGLGVVFVLCAAFLGGASTLW